MMDLFLTRVTGVWLALHVIGGIRAESIAPKLTQPVVILLFIVFVLRIVISLSPWVKSLEIIMGNIPWCPTSVFNKWWRFVRVESNRFILQTHCWLEDAVTYLMLCLLVVSLQYCVLTVSVVRRMAPVDWDQLMKLDVQELQDNATLADDMYCVLSEVCIILSLHWNCTVPLFLQLCILSVKSVVNCIVFLL